MVFVRSLRSPHILPRLQSTAKRLIHHASPQDKTEKPFYYITTPIFYPNASPHIGHLYSLVTADVFARYQRLKGHNVKLLTGTDEHGLKIQKAARDHFGEAGREREFCDALSERFWDLAGRANISSTSFLRTSSEKHHRAVEDVWRKLYSKRYIYKSPYTGWYSITDECFYTDAQVSNFRALETGSPVEWASEENYMFRLSAFRDALLQHYKTHPKSVYPPQYHENVLTMLGDQGASVDSANGKKGQEPEDFVLGDISISRPRSRLRWGVQVPDDPEQTVYVWFDALLIYLTGVGYPWASTSPPSPLTPQSPPPCSSGTSAWTSTPSTPSEPSSAHTSTPTPATSYTSSTPSPFSSTFAPSPGWAQGWPADIQVIGKDILRFHAIYFPAILLALSGGDYVPPPPPALGSSISTAAAASSSSAPSTPTDFRPAGTPTGQAQPEPQLTPPVQRIPLPGTLLTHAHWTFSQKKMSKSLGNVADPLAAMDKWGVDVVRYYLIRVGGRWRGDVDWSDDQLSKYQKEIHAQLGNYFLRITSPTLTDRAKEAANGLDVHSGFPDDLKRLYLLHSSSDTSRYAPSSSMGDDDLSEASKPVQVQVNQTGAETDVELQWEPTDPNYKLLRLTLTLPGKVERCMEGMEAGQALGAIVGVLKAANKTLTAIAPWDVSTDPLLVHTTRLVGLETLRVAAVSLLPFIPDTAEKLLDALGFSPSNGARKSTNTMKDWAVLGEEVFGFGSGTSALEEREEKEKVEKGRRDGQGHGTTGGEELMKLWERWKGREVNGIRLF